MARRRFNKKFAIGLAAAAVVIPAGVLVAVRLKPKDPAVFVAAGDLSVSKGEYSEAIAAYAYAATLRPADPDIHLKLARVHYALRAQDGNAHIPAAIREWRRAEELNPKLLEAWQGLMVANQESALNTAQHAERLEDLKFLLPKQFAVAQDAAQQVLKLDPTDVRARSAIPILSINLWLLNLAIPQSAEEQAKPVDQQMTTDQRIEQAVTQLTGLMRDHPGDPDLPYWVARAKINQAARLSSGGADGSDVHTRPTPGRRPGDAPADPTAADPTAADAATADAAASDAAADPAGGRRPGAGGAARGTAAGDRNAEIRALLGEAAVAFDDPIARQPANAALYARKAELLGILQRVDLSRETAADYQRARRDALDHAQQLTAPADPLYTTYRVNWADFLAATDPGRAEGVYKDMLAHPAGPGGGAATAPSAAARQTPVQRLASEVTVRDHYARLLARDATRRGDALDVLKPVPLVPPQGLEAQFQQPVGTMLARVRLLRAQILTDAVDANPNERGRAALADQARAEIDAAAANPTLAGEYDLPKARGRLLLSTGQYRAAIQTLSDASDKLAAATGGGVDYQLLGWLAQAYAQGEQTGQAIKLLEQAARSPAAATSLPTHLLLASLYLQEQDYDRGRQQVSWLTERYPDDPRVIQLQLRALGREPDPAAVAPLYARLPERTTAEVLDKAGWAQRTHNGADTERLYRLILKDRPGDVSTSVALANLLGRAGRLGEANDALDAAIKVNPDRRSALEMAKAELNGASPAALQGEVSKVIGDMKDPLGREVAYWHLAQSANDQPGQLDHLRRAVALAPDNVELLNSLFLTYLAAKDYPKARAMLPHLSDKNVDQAGGMLFKFRLALAEGDVPTALSIGRQLTQTYPQFASSWEYLGEAQQAAGQLEAACQQFTTALDHQGNNPAAMQHLVDCTIRMGHLEDARRYIADARRKFPDNPVYREQQVRVELAYGDPESVLPIVDDAVRAHPDATQAYGVAVQAYAIAAQRRAGKGDADGAAKFMAHAAGLLTDALKRFPDNLAFASQLAQIQSLDGSDAGVAAAAATFRALAATDRWRSDPALPDVMLGRMFLAARRAPAAVAPLRHALAVAPDSVDARTTLADALVATGKPQDALDALAPAKAVPAVRGKYVDLLLALHRPADAEADLKAGIAADPKDTTPPNLLAHVYAAQGKWADALATADAALAANPANAGGYFIRGTVYADRPDRDLEAAARDLSTFRQAFPNNVQGRVALAAVLEARGDLDGASRELEAAVAAAPDDKGVRLRLVHTYLAVTPPRTLDAQQVVTQALASPQLAHDPDVQRVAAVVWLRAGDNARAVAAIRDAMANAPDQRAMLDEYLNVLLATGNHALLLEESAKFVNDPNRPPTWDVYDFRGRAHAAAGDKAAASADFVQALDLAGTAKAVGPALAVAAHAADALGPPQAVDLVAPRATNSVLWKLVLANCYQRANDHDRALATADAAMAAADELSPDDRLSLTRTAAVLDMSAVPPRAERAVALLRAVLKDRPDDIDALNNLACCLAETVTPPRPQEALPYSTHAYELVRKGGRINPFIYDTYAWTLILAGKWDDGIEVLHQVIDQATFPDAHYHLGVAYLRKKQPDDAKREFASADDVLQQHPGQSDPALPAKIEAARKEADDQIKALQPAAGINP